MSYNTEFSVLYQFVDNQPEPHVYAFWNLTAFIEVGTLYFQQMQSGIGSYPPRLPSLWRPEITPVILFKRVAKDCTKETYNQWIDTLSSHQLWCIGLSGLMDTLPK